MSEQFGPEHAEAIVGYYQRTRGVGHTMLSFEGIKAHDGEIFLVAESRQHAENLRQFIDPEAEERIEIIPLSDARSRLAGLSERPLAIDHFAVETLLVSLTSDIHRQQSEIRRLGQENVTAKTQVANMTEEIELLKTRMGEASEKLKEALDDG